MSKRVLPVRRLALAGAATVIFACTGCAAALTGDPISVDRDQANLAGKVVSDADGNVEYWVEYGPTKAYGTESGHITASVLANTLVSVEAPIFDLLPAATYHYRFCATDSTQRGGPLCGEDRRFTTQTVDCGDTLTTDVRLTGNLQCLREPGLTVGADGVDINLGGYNITQGIFSGGGGPPAIDNGAGFADMTLRNGSLTNVGEGVHVTGGTRNRILNLDVGAAGNGVTIEGGSFHEVRGSDLGGRSVGLLATGSNSLLVTGNVTRGSFGSGIFVTGDLVRILGNEANRGGDPFANPSGITFTGSGARIADNRVDGAWNGGIKVTGASNVVVDNLVTGARFPLMGDEPWAGDGIFVGAFSRDTVLRRNRTDDNEGDGIEVQATGTRLEGNAAFGNGDWGIDAVAGAIDLGGSTAGGNGNPGQCRNVFCQ